MIFTAIELFNSSIFPKDTNIPAPTLHWRAGPLKKQNEMTEWNDGMEYLFYIPCIREWPFDSYGDQEDYTGSKPFR